MYFKKYVNFIIILIHKNSHITIYTHTHIPTYCIHIRTYTNKNSHIIITDLKLRTDLKSISRQSASDDVLGGCKFYFHFVLFLLDSLDRILHTD